MPAFTAIVRTDPAGGFEVSFPDLALVKAHADTRVAAPDVAFIALLEELRRLHAAGAPIPVPGTLRLAGEPGDASGEAILVEV